MEEALWTGPLLGRKALGLDLGCGLGLTVLHCLAADLRVLGVDGADAFRFWAPSADSSRNPERSSLGRSCRREKLGVT